MIVKQRLTGFSLIELLIVMAIAIMTLALLAPRISGALERLELKQLTQKMATSLKATRTQAISTGKDAIWTLDLKQHYFNYGRNHQQVSYSDDIDIAMTTASKQQLSETKANIRFFADGTSTGGEIRLSQDKRHYRIQIAWLTGRVKTYDR